MSRLTKINWRVAGIESDKPVVKILLALLAAYVYSVLLQIYDVPLPDARIDVTTAFHTLGLVDVVPSELEYGNLVDLNDRAHPEPTVSPAAEYDYGWFTSILTLNVPPNRIWGLYIPDVPIGSVVHVNGHMLGESSRNSTSMGGKYGFMYLNIPNGMLRPGENEIQIGLMRAQVAPTADLQPYSLGSDSELFPAMLRAQFVFAELPKIILTMLLISIIVFSSIAYYCPEDRLYGLFSVVCAIWFALSLINVDWLISSEYQLIVSTLNDLFLIAFGCSLVAFCGYFGNLDLHRLSVKLGFLTLLCLLVSLVLQVGFGASTFRVLFFLVFLALVCFAILLLNSIQNTNIKSRKQLLIFCMLVIVACVGTNLWSQLSTAQSSLGQHLLLVSPLFVVTMSLWLLRDFVASRSELAMMNQELEIRVENRTQQLAESFETNRALEREAVLNEERQRIMMDMHDGIGNQLVALVAQTKSPTPSQQQIRESASEALTDLRLVVDSISPAAENLTSTMAMFRHRLKKSMPTDQMKLVWKMEDLPETTDSLGPGKVLQVLRIVQEACSNAIKYSAGDTLTIHTGVSEEGIFIKVTDNGNGFEVDATNGHGLRNMRKRAEASGMKLSINSNTNGVSVYLIVQPATAVPDHLPAQPLQAIDG